MGEPSDPGRGKFRLKLCLKSILEGRRITAAELSRKSGVPKQVLSLWLAGVEPRKLIYLKQVAEVLQVTIDELCFGVTSQGPNTDSDAAWIEGVFVGRLRRVRNHHNEEE